MKVVIAGSSGLIGQALASEIRARGGEATCLVRRPAQSDHEVTWDPSAGKLDPEVLKGADAVIALNGASVGHLPWTKSFRRTLWKSRAEATRTIVDALHALAEAGEVVPPLVSASASGFYGSEPGVKLTETSKPGNTFLARLCTAWEAEAMRASDVTDVTLLRTSPVLHPDGVLGPMVRLTRLGLGGPLGSGRQVWPWISLEDEVRAIIHVVDSGITGPVNLAGPTPATNAEIGRALAKKLRRPFLIPTPGFALRMALGRDATDSLLLADADVRPVVLEESGFEFTHPTAKDAIDASL